MTNNSHFWYQAELATMKHNAISYLYVSCRSSCEIRHKRVCSRWPSQHRRQHSRARLPTVQARTSSQSPPAFHRTTRTLRRHTTAVTHLRQIKYDCSLMKSVSLGPSAQLGSNPHKQSSCLSHRLQQTYTTAVKMQIGSIPKFYSLRL